MVVLGRLSLSLHNLKYSEIRAMSAVSYPTPYASFCWGGVGQGHQHNHTGMT